MIRAIRNRFLTASYHYVNRRFLGPFNNGRDNASNHWRDVIDKAGVDLVEVIRLRPDTKGVFLVDHTHWGRCVLKTLFTTRHPNRGLANLMIAKLVSESEAAIFPRIYAATDSYIIEEYIQGERFRHWMRNSYDFAVVQDYFLGLKEWSQQAKFSEGSAALEPYEIQEICSSYIKKCFWLSRYCSPFANVASMTRLSSIGGGFPEKIKRLAALSETVSIPRAMMCGDMSNVNLIVDAKCGRMYNIDYEFMSSGHWGFDCAYFISSLRKMGDPEPILREIEELLFSKDYLGKEECSDFFRLYASVLCDVTKLFFRPR